MTGPGAAVGPGGAGDAITLARMQRNTGLPWLVLTAVGALGVAAALLGFSMAPTSANLAAHNGIGETVAAPSFHALQANSQSPIKVTVSYTAPDRLTITQSLQGRTQVQHVHGPQVQSSLENLATLETHSFAKGPSGSGGATYVSKSSAVNSQGILVHELVTVTVQNGYMVGLGQQLSANTPTGPQQQSAMLRFLKIGDWTVAPL